jgi:hypothetical protein
VRFDENGTNGFDGLSIKSAPGTNFADRELLSFGLSDTTGDTSILVSGQIDQTIDLGLNSLVGATVDFDLVYDTNAGTFTLGAKLHSDATFSTVSGLLKEAGNVATQLGFAALNTGVGQNMIVDDLKITTQPGDYRVPEDALFEQVFVTRTGDNPNTAFDVDYTTVDGTAKAGVDYVMTSGTLSFASGDTTPQAILIPIKDNHTIDGNRQFFVQLTTATQRFGNPTNVVLDNTLATVTIVDNDTGFELSQPTVVIANDQPFVSFAVQRVGITQGAASVNWSTLAGTASPGVDYGTLGNSSEVSGVLNFADGQTIASFSVPLHEAAFVGVKSFSMVLTGAMAATAEVAALPAGIVVDAFPTGISSETVNLTSADVTAPTVSAIHLVGPKGAIKSIQVVFSEALTQSPAESTDSYGLFAVRNDSRFGTGARSKVKLRAASYDAATHTVTLIPAQPLGTGKFYQLVVLGSGVTDLALNHVHGDSTAPTLARNLSMYFARGSSLTYTDHNGDRVHLNLRKGGFMDLVRNSQGDATLVQLQQTTAGRSVLDGSVVQQGLDADGVTTIDAITGSTGVTDLLHNPPFSVTTIS